MAPIDVWYKWVQRHRRGSVVLTRAGHRVPMAKLAKLWDAIGYDQTELRAKFVDEQVAPLLLAKKTYRRQPSRTCGHDTSSVTREVLITKKFKTGEKYKASKLALQRTKDCFCTPALVAYNEETKALVQEDLGHTVRVLGAKQKLAIVEHFKREHGMRIHDCQVSPQNVCRRTCGRLCLVDIAKWSEEG